jgi:DNA-binding NarL/FixJ family response regulator
MQERAELLGGHLEIHSQHPALRTRAVEHGAAAVLDKLTHLGQVVHAVRRILAGGVRFTGDRPVGIKSLS